MKSKQNERKMIIKSDEQKTTDWAVVLAKIITGNDIEKYLLEHNLYKT